MRSVPKAAKSALKVNQAPLSVLLGVYALCTHQSICTSDVLKQRYVHTGFPVLKNSQVK
jgi:hypothetical protein